MTMVNNFMNFVNTIVNPNVVLLRQEEVVRWLFGDLSFLPALESPIGKAKQLKAREDRWGKDIMKKYLPDLKFNNQWTNLFGEHICKEIYILFGKHIDRPKKLKNIPRPDWETSDLILEVKTQTFYTTGTAGEKIMGVPCKFAMIPTVYGAKKLLIVCIGCAEKISRNSYGILPGGFDNEHVNDQVKFWKTKNIEFIGATDLLKQLSSQ